jgi:CDP-glucose 4,6-dehydratase
MRALSSGLPIISRQPDAIRPWQHVLEPLAGYLMLAARMLCGSPAEQAKFCSAWNFGPDLSAMCPVSSLLDALVQAWGSGAWQLATATDHRHEAGLLRLSSEKAIVQLGWQPRWTLAETIERTVEWYRAFFARIGPLRMRTLSREQVAAHETPHSDAFQPVQAAL